MLKQEEKVASRKRVEGYFDRRAENYTKEFAFGLWLKSKERERSDLLGFLSLKPGDRILDAGCGAGYHLDYLRERGIEAEGFDISPKMVEVCKKKGYHVKQVDLESDWVNDEYYEKFDKIYSPGMLEFCSEDLKVIQNFYSALKRGGELGLLVTNTSLLGVAYKVFHKIYATRKTVNIYSLKSIQKLVLPVGFIFEEVVYSTPQAFCAKFRKP